ncbi:hypothetical protein RHMOL_Rhmol04G0202600 [Rhododendron molle]|uniref:Uncharacterized protein n=1 Tax=Rhododendron molle TaxID=49168 RepID=A0ACC0P4Z8_RHOML|nr:hypothetical protein RHMOL_Rhmol04G0202600 [Rhododendron molle]
MKVKRIWFDNWHPSGPLYKLFSNRAFANLGTSSSAKVSSVIRDGDWNWPRPGSSLIHQIQRLIPSTMQPHGDTEDEVIWSISPTDHYNTKYTWEALRHRGRKVQWAALVWFSRSVSKWSFILWLACLRRLATKERLRKWGMVIDPGCVLSSQRHETLQHLFFACSYSRSIWQVVLHRFQVQRTPDEWDNELMWAVDHCRGKSFKAFLFKLVFAAGVYHLWLERNTRVFCGQHRGADIVLASIGDNVRLRVCTWEHFPNSLENQSLCRCWNISSKVLGA